MCITAIKQNVNAFKYVKNQTLAICLEVLKIKPEIFIKYQKLFYD